MGRVVQIQFFLSYIIQDRVEHCDWTGFMGHSGTFSTIPGISCPITLTKNTQGGSNTDNHYKVKKQLASCIQCYSQRYKNVKEGHIKIAADSNDNCLI